MRSSFSLIPLAAMLVLATAQGVVAQAPFAALFAAAHRSSSVGVTAPARATGFPFETRAKAIAGHRTRSDRFLLLNGRWHFALSPADADAPTGFERLEQDVAGWGSMAVPADWRSERDGATVAGAVGSYRREVDLPAGWAGSAIVLHIGGAGCPYRAWFNGVAIGAVADAHLPAEFDVTRLVGRGRATIAIQVDCRARDAASVAGIEREVFLMAVPKTRVRDVVVHATPGARAGVGRLAVDLAVTPGAATVARITLLDGDREVLSRGAPVAAGGVERRVTLTAPARNIRPWSAEDPALYMLLVELYDAQGAIIQSTYARIGFRTVAIRRGAMTVDGRPVALRGVDWRAPQGDGFRVATPDSMEHDIAAWKRDGVNAIRTVGHPADPRLYELADRHGLYVIDEAAACGGRSVAGMIARDRNHPSILAWSLGGLAGAGPDCGRAAAAARHRDATRPVVYFAGASRPGPLSQRATGRPPMLYRISFVSRRHGHVLQPFADGMAAR